MNILNTSSFKNILILDSQVQKLTRRIGGNDPNNLDYKSKGAQLKL